ncbi:MAG: alpha/beta hydrolase [Marmoricola sp.]
MKRVLGVCTLVLAAVVVGLTGAQPSSGAPAVATFASTLSTWKTCGSLQCATITLPMDYAHPDNGKTVKLALSRAQASPLAGSYAGMMLLNPGGPGGSGTYLPNLQGSVPGNAAQRYDWVGFDPRGVGASVPSLHCNSHYFGANRPNFVPTTQAIYDYWKNKSNIYAAQCGKSTAKALLPFLTTRDTVRDMEMIRAAYQAQASSAQKPVLAKLNFYGFSYGTWLGQVYASTYPAKVGRFILDGVVDPSTYWYKSNLQQDIWFDKNLNTFFAWIAAHNSTFHLGTSAKTIRSGYNALLKRLDRYPSAAGRLGPDELTDAVISAPYYVFEWADIARDYAQLVRNKSGTALWNRYVAGNQGDDNGYAIYLATECTDAPAPSFAQQRGDTWALYRSYPYLAWDNTWYNMPCLNWKAPPRPGSHPFGTYVHVPILLINETRDAATPFAGALNVRKRFPTASLIAGIGGTTHAGSLHGVTCVDNAIAAYLNDGTVPTRKGPDTYDLACPKVPPPSPTGGLLGRTKADPGMPTAVQNRLQAAQSYSLR